MLSRGSSARGAPRNESPVQPRPRLPDARPGTPTALEKAYGFLLNCDEETDITEYFTNAAFPAPEEAGSWAVTVTVASRGRGYRGRSIVARTR